MLSKLKLMVSALKRLREGMRESELSEIQAYDNIRLKVLRNKIGLVQKIDILARHLRRYKAGIFRLLISGRRAKIFESIIEGLNKTLAELDAQATAEIAQDVKEETLVNNLEKLIDGEIELLRIYLKSVKREFRDTVRMRHALSKEKEKKYY